MNRRKYPIMGGLLAVVFTLAAHAHDPSEHAGGPEAPDCRAMGDAVNGPLDKNDPVVQALMKQCSDVTDRSRSLEDDESPDHHHSAGSGHSNEQDVKSQ